MLGVNVYNLQNKNFCYLPTNWNFPGRGGGGGCLRVFNNAGGECVQPSDLQNKNFCYLPKNRNFSEGGGGDGGEELPKSVQQTNPERSWDDA